MTRESLDTPENSEQTSLYQQILHGVVAVVYLPGAKLREKQLRRDFNVRCISATQIFISALQCQLS
jgi:DNA-binding GntR family transcriptional regulator